MLSASSRELSPITSSRLHKTFKRIDSRRLSRADSQRAYATRSAEMADLQPCHPTLSAWQPSNPFALSLSFS